MIGGINKKNSSLALFVTKRLIVLAAGASGGGKTTIVDRLIAELGVGIKIPLDEFYHDQGPIDTNRAELDIRARVNYDHPSAIDFELANKLLAELYSGQTINLPQYSFERHTRKPITLKVEPNKLIFVEGIFVLRDELKVPEAYRVFVQTDLAIACTRRLVRDVNERGRRLEQAAGQLERTVIPGYRRFVEPTRHDADYVLSWTGEVDGKFKDLCHIIRARMNGEH
ncbi:uridine kinase [Candidatus Woesearchaeota archaeon CG10_big_fil_rev_8_21_14_0_10_37_12]|nr:MAG: uridine kinase [Candidatus Woesearchaeota archaeon CG10_big_fil_rev_8_21_14_0_10_37_12]